MKKIKQNKKVRYLTETKLLKNAIISLKMIDLRTGLIELKKFFLDTEINHSIVIRYRNFMETNSNE